MRVVTIVCRVITALALIGLAIWFITGSVFGVGWGGNRFPFFNIGGRESLSGPFEVAGSQSVSTAGLTSINIDWVAGHVTVLPYDGNEIMVTESAQRQLRDNERFAVSTSGDTLVIRFTERPQRRMPAKQLEVLVPRELGENMTLLKIDTVSGGVSANEIGAERLSVESVSGSVNISGDFARADFSSVSGALIFNNAAPRSRVDVDSTSGAINLTGNFDNVDVNNVSGSIAITSSVVPGTLSVNTVSGSTTVTIPNEGTITVSHSSVSGRFSSEIPVTMQSSGAQFDFSSVSGGTTINALVYHTRINLPILTTPFSA